MKKRRQYIQFLEKSIEAMKSALDRFNSVRDPYKIETTLILLTNAWELLAKSVLLKKHQKIESKRGNIPAEVAVHKLTEMKILNENQEDHVQQVISLRNECVHSILPPLPQEVLFHLGFYSAKFFKDIIESHFPNYKDWISGNYLAISFDTLTTYADKVQKLVAKTRRKNTSEQRLVWLLERGIRFKGGNYIAQDKFEEEIKRLRSKKLLPNLAIGKFIKQAEMLIVIPIQAPKGYTADISLRKGSRKIGSALPVVVKKTDIETDYPYLTGELAEKLGKGRNFIARTIRNLNLKGDSEFHQEIRSSRSGRINRYSEKTLQHLQEFFAKNPDYNPYKVKT